MSIKADQITKKHIVRILHRISERGADVLANRVRAYLSSTFKFGIEFDDSVLALKHGIKFHIQFNPVTIGNNSLPTGKSIKIELQYLHYGYAKTGITNIQ